MYFIGCVYEKYSINLKQRAQLLRAEGYSLAEIICLLPICKSTASVWTREILLTSAGTVRKVHQRQVAAQKSKCTWQQKQLKQKMQRRQRAAALVEQLELSQSILKLLCAFLYWGEGGKKGCMKFINSDPLMIKTFLIIFRKVYEPDENKFRVLVHLHEYHHKERIEQFWSELTNIPLGQFHRSYIKPHTARRIKPHYLGCVSITYYDIEIARELKAIYNAFALELIKHRAVM